MQSSWQAQVSWLLEATRSFCEALLGVPTQKTQKREVSGQSRGPRHLGLPCERSKRLREWSARSSGRSPKRLRNGLAGAEKIQERLRNGLGEAQKSSEMVREKPKKAQKWFGRTPKSSETVGKKPKKGGGMVWLNGLGPKKLKKGSEMVWRTPKKLRKCLSGGSRTKAQKWSGRSTMVWKKPKKAPKWCGGSPRIKDRVAPAIVLGFGSLPFDSLDGQCVPCLALERPAAPALPGLHVQCSQVAREARTASGSQVLVASPQQDFRVSGLGFRVSLSLAADAAQH